MRKNKLAAGAVVLAVGLGGVTTTAVSAAPSTAYHLSADKSKLKFNKTTIRAKAGKVTLSMSNPSPIGHNIGIQGKGSGKVVTKGGTSHFTATLKKGTYTFLCTVDGHAKAG
ncbi:MAG TPA: cupredoxin domain-containing protein, partial [Solirubrobacter sp.]